MSQDFSVYCDESCHLEHDRQHVMVLGAIWCPREKVREINARIAKIKLKHKIPRKFEIKWTKVSPAKQTFYLELLDYFFDDDDLHFRALIVPDKSVLEHKRFQQTHDDWYYKMYFEMLKVIFNPEFAYNIYLDIKDTRSATKVSKLHDVLSNNLYDFSRQIIQEVQTVRSHEIGILQIVDLLIGIVSYVNRGLTTSPAKQVLVERMRKRSSYHLTKTTLLREDKVNLFRWDLGERQA